MELNHANLMVLQTTDLPEVDVILVRPEGLEPPNLSETGF